MKRTLHIFLLLLFLAAPAYAQETPEPELAAEAPVETTADSAEESPIESLPEETAPEKILSEPAMEIAPADTLVDAPVDTSVEIPVEPSAEETAAPPAPEETTAPPIDEPAPLAEAAPAPQEEQPLPPAEPAIPEYATFNMNNIAKLYWRFGRYQPDNLDALEPFLMLNECGIYTKFKADDFKWREVLEAASASIEAEAKTFPIKFELAQPLKLGEYDPATNLFEVQQEFQLEKSPLVYVEATDEGELACPISNLKVGKAIPFYRHELIVRLSEPFELREFPVETDIARSYIDRTLAIYNKMTSRNKRRISSQNLRNAYLSMNLKIINSGEDYVLPNAKGTIPLYNATLESVAIYGDAEKTELLYEKNYRKPRIIDALEQQYRDEYAAARAAAGR